jgi:hypothetical protein
MKSGHFCEPQYKNKSLSFEYENIMNNKRNKIMK